MPQMAPLSWVSLYMFFTLIYLISIILTYYSFLYTPIKTKKTAKKISINWKW